MGRAALAAALIVAGAGGGRSLDAQAVDPGRAWLHQLIDPPASQHQYGYAPAIVWLDGRYHMFYCSSGTGPDAWDLIRYATSADGFAWSAPVVILTPTDAVGERATCDPSVVQFDAGDGPFYYLFYSGNARDVQTVMFVARAAAIGGPYLKYTRRGTWERDAPDPMVILSPLHAAPDGTPWYGAGQQAVVASDGRLYSWFTDDTATYPDLTRREKRVMFASTTDPARWPSAVATNVSDDSDASADVKLDPATGEFVMFQIRGEHSRAASLVRRTSLDGVTWSDAVLVADEPRFAAWAHNIGIGSDADGSLPPHVLAAFGAPHDLSPTYDNDCNVSPSTCWGRWDVYGGFLATLTVSVAGEGTVVSEPAGILCGDRCAATFAPGLRVALAAEPADGAALAGWAGPRDCADGIVAAAEATRCTAQFTAAAVPAPGRGLALNGDRPGDIFLWEPAGGRWASGLSAGDGSFGLIEGTWQPEWTITPAHLNTDRLTDFFLYNRTTGAWAQARSTGRGTFSFTTGQFTLGWRFVAGRFRPGLIDDLIAYNPVAGGAFICNVDGAGGFIDFSYKPWSPGWALTVADLTGDGLDDVFTYNTASGDWFVCIKSGDWGFSYAGGRWSAGWTVAEGDFDGNGRDDLFVYNVSNGRWCTCLTDGRGGFTYYGETWSTGWMVRAGRLDADGRDDLFVYNPANGWWYQCLSDGTGGFGRYVGGRWSPQWTLALTDLNADGLDDVVVYSATGGDTYQCLTIASGGFTEYSYGMLGPGYVLISPLEGRQLLD